MAENLSRLCRVQIFKKNLSFETVFAKNPGRRDSYGIYLYNFIRGFHFHFTETSERFLVFCRCRRIPGGGGGGLCLALFIVILVYQKSLRVQSYWFLSSRLEYFKYIFSFSFLLNSIRIYVMQLTATKKSDSLLFSCKNKEQVFHAIANSLLFLTLIYQKGFGCVTQNFSTLIGLYLHRVEKVCISSMSFHFWYFI